MDVNNLKPDVVYVLNKNEGIIGVFNKEDKDTLIDPLIKEVQNQEAELHFQIPASSKKWKNIYNPENLYLADNKVFSANFSDAIERDRDENGEDIITVKAYERQKLLEREFAKIYNSTAGFEELDDMGNPVPNGKLYIDEFMVIILSNGDKNLINGKNIVPTTFEKGTSGYALQALLYRTGWKVGTCDVEGKFDLELDQENIYNMIKKVQELWGGILVVDSLNKIIHHRDETKYLPYSGYEVKYKKNIQSNKYIGDNKIITELCPLGEGSLNIKSVNDDSIWLSNHEYTDSVLKAIENNDDIYDPEQLKRWGERKLKELCKPRRELQVTTALLKAVKGHKHEQVALNHIVDVIDYEFIEEKTVQLRVIAYEHFIWNDADAVLEIGDITLESTDIFKKTIGATNLINNGTLDTSKVIDYYKNGQSLKETLRQVDQVIINTKSEFTKADDEIKASVEQVTSYVDNLNNDIVNQSQTLAQLIIQVGKISSEVSTITGTTEIITGHSGKVVLEKALEGYLYGISIHGYDGSFGGTVVSDNAYVSDSTYVLDEAIYMNIYTKNRCPSSPQYYEQGYYINGEKEESIDYLRTKEPFEIQPSTEMYCSIQDMSFRIYDIFYYNKKKEYINKHSDIASELDTIINGTEGVLITPENAYYANIVFKKADNVVAASLLNTIEEIEDESNESNISIDENNTTIVVPGGIPEEEPDETPEQYEGDMIPEIIKRIKPQLENGDLPTDFVDYNIQRWKFLLDEELRALETEGYVNDISPYEQYGYEIGSYSTETGLKTEAANRLRINSLLTVGKNSTLYFLIKDEIFNFNNVFFYNQFGTYLGDWNSLNPEDTILDQKNKIITLPEGTYYITYNLKKADNTDISEKEQVALSLEVREKNKVYDEFTILDKKAMLIRRIGVDSDGNKYVLTNAEYISYGTIEIPIVGGQNVIEIPHYTPTVIVEYVKKNIYTDLFATKVEVSTKFEQTDQMILLAATKKVSKDELIQEFNSQISITPEIINIEGDKITIKSSYFQLTANGEITASKGTIAGWTINSTYLGKGLAGIQGIGSSTSDATVFFAGKGLGHRGNPAFYVTNKGNMHLKSLDIRGVSSSDIGQIKIYNESDQVGSTITFSTVDTYNVVAGNGGTTPTKGKCMHGYDMTHDYRCNWSDSKLYFIIDDYNMGYVTASSSDARLKKNITDIPQELLYVIEEVELKQFKLIDGNDKYKYGIIAQDLVNAFEKYGLNYKEYDIISESQLDLKDETLYFHINYEQVLILKTQLLENRVQSLERKLEKSEDENYNIKEAFVLLAEKLDCTAEIEEILGE